MRRLSILPLRWSPSLNIDWAAGIVAYRVTTCPEHTQTFTSRVEAGALLRRAAQDGRCPRCGVMGALYDAADLVTASGRPWADVAAEYDPDPDPDPSDLFSDPAMLGPGIYAFAR